MLSGILGFLKPGKETARSHIKNLIEMAAADGKFEQSELALLKTIAKRNGISEGQLEELRAHAESVQFMAPEEKKSKFQLLYDLVHMMIVDKDIHENEVKLCQQIVEKLGYRIDNSRELIESIRTNIQNNNSMDETMKRVSLLIG